MPAAAGIDSKESRLHSVATNRFPSVGMTGHDLVFFHVVHRRVRHGVNVCHWNGNMSRRLGKCAEREETCGEDGEQLVHEKPCGLLI